MEIDDLAILQDLGIADDHAGDVTPSGSDYIDARGCWPVYHHGLHAVELRDQPREITVSAARELLL